jgi:hypothetical protein
MWLPKRGIQRVIFDRYTPVPTHGSPPKHAEDSKTDGSDQTVSRPLALRDVPFAQHCATLVSQQLDSLFTDCSVSFAAPSASPQTDALGRKRLHFCSFGPRARPSTHVGQSWPFVAAAACNADERPTLRWCHLTTNAESTGNMPTWLRTQHAASVSVAENTTSLACLQNRDSSQLGITSLPSDDYHCPSTNATQEPSPRHTGWLWSASIRNSGSPPFNVVPARLASPPVISFEPHSIARASPTLCFALYEAQSPSGENFRTSHRMSLSLFGSCCCLLTATFVSLPLL